MSSRVSHTQKRRRHLERKRRLRERRRNGLRCYTIVLSDLLPDALQDIGALADPDDEEQVKAAITRVLMLALPSEWRELIEERVQARDSETR